MHLPTRHSCSAYHHELGKGRSVELSQNHIRVATQQPVKLGADRTEDLIGYIGQFSLGNWSHTLVSVTAWEVNI